MNLGEGAQRLITYVTSITTWKQALIVIVLGAFILLGTLIYQHPYWLENAFRFRHGLPLHEPEVP